MEQQHLYQQQQQLLGEPNRYFELEQAVQQLRPLVIQVLKTQMYHNTTAAVDLRRGIRRVREVCKQLRAETVLLAKTRRGAPDHSPAFEAAPHVPSNLEQSGAKRHKPDHSSHQSPVAGGSPSTVNFVIVQPGEDQKVPVASTTA